MKPAAQEQPGSLVQLLASDARQSCDARLKEVKTMSGKLAMLDVYMPAVRAAGITIRPEDIHSSWARGELQIGAGVLGHTRNACLANVLAAQGMREESRKESGGYVWMTLAKGRLRVGLMIDARAVHLLELGV